MRRREWSRRWNETLDGDCVHHDLYSAFLLYFVRVSAERYARAGFFLSPFEAFSSSTILWKFGALPIAIVAYCVI